MATTAPELAWHDRTLVDRGLGIGALVMLGAALIAVVRGQPHWHELPVQIWAHLALLLVALALTPVLLFRAKGTRWHRRLGWVWAGSMVGTALVSFTIRFANDGGFSLIHILSLWVCIQVPMIVWLARRHLVRRHRRTARTLVVFALLTAGFFTFPFDRLMGRWLFG